MSFAHIAPGIYAQHHRPAVPLPDLDGGGLIRRKMHVLAVAGLEALGCGWRGLCLDSCAVEQDGRRLGGL